MVVVAVASVVGACGANVLAALPKSAHPGAIKAMREIYNAEDREHAAARRIDEASVGVEVAWEERTQAELAVTDAEVAAAAAVERLLAEKLAVKDVVQPTGLDQATVRRLRQLDTDEDSEADQDVDEVAVGGGRRG